MSVFKLLFLGTGAADSSPLLATEYADRLSPDHRRTSALLINDCYLIDCGHHTLDCLRLTGTPLSQIKHLFLTHLHGDHCRPDHIQTIASAKDEPLHIWLRNDAELPPLTNVILHPMDPLTSYEIDDLTVTGLVANHTDCPQHFVIERADKRFFYGCDGAWLINPSFKFMKHRGRFDLMIMDATVGDYDGDLRMAEHNCIPMIRSMRASFKTVKMADEDTVFCLSHLARTLHKPTHAEIVEQFRPDGFLVAYDGMKYEF